MSEDTGRARMALLFAEMGRAHADLARISAALCKELGGEPEAVMSAGRLATEAEMSGPGGDPTVTFDPKGFRGEGPGAKGLRYSQCSWQFLEFWGETLEWMAANPKEGKEKYSRGNLSDARKARTWSKRLREGYTPPAPPPRPEYGARNGAAASGGYGAYNSGVTAPAQPKSDDWNSKP